MTRSLAGVLIAGLVAVGGVSCKKDAPPSGGAAGAAAAGAAPTFHQPHVAKLKEAGLAADALEATDAKPYAAKACVRGAVSKLDLLLCDYPSAEAAGAAEPKLSKFVGTAVTGVVRSAATVGIALADRDKVDLAGKQINKIVKLLTE